MIGASVVERIDVPPRDLGACSLWMAHASTLARDSPLFGLSGVPGSVLALNLPVAQAWALQLPLLLASVGVHGDTDSARHSCTSYIGDGQTPRHIWGTPHRIQPRQTRKIPMGDSVCSGGGSFRSDRAAPLTRSRASRPSPVGAVPRSAATCGNGSALLSDTGPGSPAPAFPPFEATAARLARQAIGQRLETVVIRLLESVARSTAGKGVGHADGNFGHCVYARVGE